MIWKQDVREKAQKLLERRIQFGYEIQMMFESELIQNELALIGEFDAQSTFFIMTINEAIDRGNTSLSDFEIAFEGRISFHNEISTYDIYVPLYTNFPKRKFKIQGMPVIKVPVKVLYQFFSRDNLITAVRHSGIEDFETHHLPSYVLKISVVGNNKFEAWNKVSGQYTLLRGIIEYSILYNQINYSFGRGSRTKNHHPQWCLMRNLEREQTEFIVFRVEKKPAATKINWTKKQAKIFHDLIKQFDKPHEPNKSVSVLADCLRLYSQAMMSNYNHNCFLSLWQLAESLTRSENSNGQTKTVLARLTWHDPTARTAIYGLNIMESINTMSKKRNDLVHRGIDSIQNLDINLLKVLCDLGIKWLKDKSKRLKTINHLDEFYRLRTSPDKLRRAIIETVKNL